MIECAQRNGVCRVNWKALMASPRVHTTRGGCHWVTFDGIQECLENYILEDAHIPYEKGVSRDDARIAYLVNALRAGDELDTLRLYAQPHPENSKLIKVWFVDGSHRFRAYQFENRINRIPIRLEGPATKRLKRLVPAAFVP